jgi:hypothetical protein
MTKNISVRRIIFEIRRRFFASLCFAQNLMLLVGQ